MRRLYTITAILAIIISSSFSASARENERPDSTTDLSRPITSIYSLEIGKQWARSTFLSPYYYSGTNYSLTGTWSKAMPFAPDKAMMTFDSRIAAWTRLTNPAGNASMQGFDINFFWGMQAYKRLPHSITIGIGGGPELDGGVLTLLRNSNNPVSVNLSAAFSANAGITWQGRIGRLPVSATWSLRIPIVGAFFMPGYGETYYEIYLGNHSGLVHASWPGNHLRFNSRLAFQLDLGRTAMEVGYRMITDRMAANNLVTRQLTHAFTIGVIPHGLGRKSGKDKSENRVYF
ncbi:MAG: hypothetical protein K2M31_04835 [Muribaculaceae bacterium]|nr:hypothetical protein [Muribaculaceae bacterium]